MEAGGTTEADRGLEIKRYHALASRMVTDYDITVHFFLIPEREQTKQEGKALDFKISCSKAQIERCLRHLTARYLLSMVPKQQQQEARGLRCTSHPRPPIQVIHQAQSREVAQEH